MKEYLMRWLDSTNNLSVEQMLINTAVALIVGFAIYLSYWISHTGTVYSKKFNVSLVMLTILTATVMAVIGNNVALSLGMVGALSIVRYRTAVKDSRDTAYIFWAVIGGICSGAGEYLIVTIGSAAAFLVLLLLGRIKNDGRILIIVKGDSTLEREIESTIFDYFNKRAKLRVKNSTESSIEFIYETSTSLYEKAQSRGQTVMERIYSLGRIEYVNIVAQNDEIL